MTYLSVFDLRSEVKNHLHVIGQKVSLTAKAELPPLAQFQPGMLCMPPANGLVTEVQFHLDVSVLHGLQKEIRYPLNANSMNRTFLYHFSYENFRKTSDDLRDWLRNLMTQRLLDNLKGINIHGANSNCNYTFRTACLGSACLLYASNRSYCAGLRLSIKTLK